MQIVEILIILTICIVFIVYTNYIPLSSTKSIYYGINNCKYYPKYKWTQYYK